MHTTNQHTILFDMDGTIFDFATPLHKLIQQEMTLPLEVRKSLDNICNFTKVGLHELFDPREFDVNFIKQTIKRLYQNPDFFGSLQPYPGTVDLLKELSQTYRIRFCTKPSEDYNAQSESVKRHAIVQHFGKHRHDTMITSHDKTDVRGTLLFDDSPHIIGHHDPARKHIIVDQPHNQDIVGPRVYHHTLDDRVRIITQHTSF